MASLFEKRAPVIILMWLITGILLPGSFVAPACAKENGPSQSPDNSMIWMSVNVLCLTEEGQRAIGERNTLSPESLRALIEAKKAREIETLRFSTQCNNETMTLIGHKFPITWFDSKASQYSIIFVDVGIKLVVKPVTTADKKINLAIKSSISTIEDYRQEIERDTVFYFPSVKTADTNHIIPAIKNGETIIISNLLGPALEDVLKEIGEKATFYAKGSRLIIAVTPYIFPQRDSASESASLEYPSSIEMKTFRLSRSASGKFLNNYKISNEALEALVKSGGARIIDSWRVLSSGREAYLLVGRKYPLAYFDPRSGFYQVIYIDIGLKGVLKCEPLSSQRWNLAARFEYGNADPASLFGVKRDQIPLKAYTIRTESSLDLGRGESGIILALRGDYYYKVIKDILFPGIEFLPDDELIFTVTLR